MAAGSFVGEKTLLNQAKSVKSKENGNFIEELFKPIIEDKERRSAHFENMRVREVIAKLTEFIKEQEKAALHGV